MSGSSIDGAASPSEYGMQQILSSGETTLLVVLPDGDTRSMPAIREKGVYLQEEFASIGRWIVALDEHTGGGRGSSLGRPPRCCPRPVRSAASGKQPQWLREVFYQADAGQMAAFTDGTTFTGFVFGSGSLLACIYNKSYQTRHMQDDTHFMRVKERNSETFNSDWCQSMGWCQKPSKHNNMECNIHSPPYLPQTLNSIAFLW